MSVFTNIYKLTTVLNLVQTLIWKKENCLKLFNINVHIQSSFYFYFFISVQNVHSEKW